MVIKLTFFYVTYVIIVDMNLFIKTIFYNLNH